MRTTLSRPLSYALPLALLLAWTAVPSPAFALQQPDAQDAPQYPSQDNSTYSQPPDNSAPPGDYSQTQANAGYQAFTPDQLDNLLSPIALYPDPLLAQVLVASTFPDQIQQAANYLRANGNAAIDEQDWDVSVRAVAHYPTVVDMMADKIDWTTSLGQAYVNQSTDVSAAVQRLRHEARRVGNLASTPQQEVIEHDDYIAISPYQPQYLYVPVYDPAIIYFRRPYWGPAISFGVGFPIGGWLNLGFHWGWGGGFGGVFYTGWNPGGWGRGCWNCGWIGRSRGFVDFHNNVYVNNRYANININRTVVNRTVNVNNLNRFNNVHRNVTYNNVQANNARVGLNGGTRGSLNNGARTNANTFASNNRAITNNNNSRANVNNNYRAGQSNGGRNDRPASASNYRANQNNAVRGSASSQLPARSAQQQRPQPQQSRSANQSRPAFQSRPSAPPRQSVASRPPQQASTNRPASRPAANFNARQSAPRPQASRQPAQRSAPPQRSAPAQHSAAQRQASQNTAQHNSSHGGGERRNR
jgi:hypothetical protein